MKFLTVFWRALICAVFVCSSLFSMASDGSIDKPLRRGLANSVLYLFQDSTTARRKAEAKPQDPRQRPPQDVRNDRLREADRRAIKQVPRSVSKLKPQPVGDRVKIRGRQ